MKLFLSLALALTLAACGGKSDNAGGTGPATGTGEGTETAVAAKTCADVGTNMEAALRSDGAPDDVVSVFAGLGVTACTEDGWSQEAIDCYATTQDGEACSAMLTDDQKMSLQNRFQATVGGEGGEEPSPDGM
jgi:hypothetical protein